MLLTKTVARFLTSSSKVAHSLDWKKAGGCVLSMSITRDRIHLAVSSHPSSGDTAQSLPSIPLKTEIIDNKKVLSPAVAEELADIMQDWQVCGMVVNWPVQKEGWCGASCGHVLFTLDQLTSHNSVVSSNRPICLWDEEHHVPPEDEWGRAPVYGEPSDKTVHIASQEQYEAPTTTTVPADIWNDFCRAHWPELYYYKEAQVAASWSAGKSKTLTAASASSAPPPKTTVVDTAWLESYEDTAAYTKAAL